MMQIPGELPNGIEIDGQLLRKFTLREQLVADEVEVLESEDGARATKSDSFFLVCIMARRVSFDGVKGDIPPATIMAMTTTDYNYLMAKGKELLDLRASFRDAAQAAPDAQSGTSQAGV